METISFGPTQRRKEYFNTVLFITEYTFIYFQHNLLQNKYVNKLQSIYKASLQL